MKNYWNRRYLSGGTSGGGSVGSIKKWKWKHINDHVNITQKQVLDVGCGDLSFWKNHTCLNYIGLDFSEIIINKNKHKRQNWTFKCGDASEEHNIKGQVVLCLDMLFHIMEDSMYKKILQNLAKWTEEKLFIYTWWKDPFNGRGNWYQCYRPLLKSLSLLSPLNLIEEQRHTQVGALYVFDRIS